MRSLFLIYFTLTVHISLSQVCKEDLIPRQGENRMWGYVNLLDDWVVLPQYHKVQPFRGKAALVQRGKKYGAINCNGKAVIKCDYDLIQPFIANKAWVKKSSKWGLISDQGKLLLSPQYDEVRPIASYREQVWLRRDSLWGLFDLNSERFIYTPRFSKYHDFTEVSLVTEKGKTGMVSNVSSEVIYPFQIDHAIPLPKDRIGIEIGQKWGLLTEKGEEVVPARFDTIYHFKYNAYKVFDSSGVALIDKNGIELSQVYDTIFNYSQGRVRVKKDEKYGFISLSGKEVIALKFRYASDYNNGVVVLQTDEGYGVQNRQKNWVLKDTFDLVEETNDAKCLLVHHGTEVMVMYDLLLLNEVFSKVSKELSYGRTVVTHKNGKQSLFHAPSFKVSRLKFDAVGYLLDGLYTVRNDKLFGVIDFNEEEILPVVYNEIKPLNTQVNHLILAKKNGLYSVYDEQGNQWCRDRYKSLEVYLDNKTLIGIGHDGRVLLRDNKLLTEAYDDFRCETALWPIIAIDNKGEVLVSHSGKEIIGTRYKQLKFLSSNYYAFKIKRKWGVVTGKGKVVLKPIYDDVILKNKGKYEVIYKGDVRVVDKYGRY